MDILGPRGASFQVSDSFRPALEEAAAKVSEALSNVQGVIVEDNNFSVSVHYRMVVEEAERAKVAQAVEDVVASMPMLRRATGKMVYEMRPSADWHKGKAVEWLLERIRKENEGSVFPVYIGDDVTDEDAFSVMHDLGGIAIIVSDSATAENTAASYALQSPAEVVAFLDHFAHRGSERELFALQSQALHDLEQCVGASLPTPTSVHAPPPPSLPSPVEVAEACFADGDRFANVVHR
jgi:trehalose-phosphatase